MLFSEIVCYTEEQQYKNLGKFIKEVCKFIEEPTGFFSLRKEEISLQDGSLTQLFLESSSQGGVQRRVSFIKYTKSTVRENSSRVSGVICPPDQEPLQCLTTAY